MQPIKIDPEAAYPLTFLRMQLGVSQAAICLAEKRGLRVSKIGRKRLVLGRDLIKFLSSDHVPPEAARAS